MGVCGDEDDCFNKNDLWKEDFGLLMFQNISTGHDLEENFWNIDPPMLESKACYNAAKEDHCKVKIRMFSDAQKSHAMPQMADCRGEDTLHP